MKNTTKYIIAAVIVLALIGAGLYFFFHPKKALNLVVPNFTGLANIGVEIKGDTAYLDMNAVMENKAPYPINIQNMTYSVRLDETEIVSENHNLDLKQKPGQIDTAQLLIAMPYKTVMAVMEDIQNQDSTTVGLNFSITYETLFGEFTVPVEFTTPIKTPVAPKVEMKKVKIGFFNFKETKFELILNLELENMNEIELEVEDLKYDVEFGDDITGYGELGEPLKVKAMGKTDLRLPVIIDIDRPMKLIWDIITNKDEMDYGLHLTGKIVPKDKGQKHSPFDITVHGEAELVK